MSRLLWFEKNMDIASEYRFLYRTIQIRLVEANDRGNYAIVEFLSSVGNDYLKLVDYYEYRAMHPEKVI